MSSPSITQIISRMSESIVMAEPEDLPVLGNVHADLGLLADWAQAAGQEAVHQKAAEAADTVEKIIFREHNSPSEALAQLAQFLSQIQQLEHDSEPMVLDDAPAPAADAAPAGPADDPEDDALAGAGASFTIQTDPDLLSEFIAEAREHLDAADNELLTLESTPTADESLNAVFRAFHTIKGVAGFLDLSPVQQLAHETETLLDKARKGAMELSGPAMDVTFEANDLMKVLVESVADAAGRDGVVPEAPQLPPLLKKLRQATAGEDIAPAPASSGADDALDAAMAEAQAEQPTPAPPAPPAPAAETAPAKPAATPPQPTGQKAPAPDAPAAAKQRFSGIVQETIKVDARRLDYLVDTIGEMVIAEAMVRQSFIGTDAERARVPQILGQLDKITRELQELAMSLRMVPVRSAFQRMARLARDTSKKLNKPIDFVTAGDDTELDKTVVDVIGDPLVHMVRNAVDHGLEATPADRVAAGKPEKGRIELRARHQGGSILIEICDDGRGMDRDVILNKAIERGIVQENDTLSDHEVYNLIFEPGLSTAKQVSDVSGRGVGLDVVKKNIQSLRGKVEISSTPGQGSVFSIRLPLTLAIIEGMVVRSAGQRYIIPTLSITRMIRHNDKEIATVLRRDEMLQIGGDLIPLFHLSRIFGQGQGQGHSQPQAPSENSEIVVVEDEGRDYALVIDEILGQQQIVIKPLGEMFKQASGVSGGAIMPDGKVGLILDIAGLIAMTQCRPTRAAA